eukprot:2836074-Amphidinium_carterae.1
MSDRLDRADLLEGVRHMASTMKEPADRRPEVPTDRHHLKCSRLMHPVILTCILCLKSCRGVHFLVDAMPSHVLQF